jgi:hypothetical protein
MKLTGGFSDSVSAGDGGRIVQFQHLFNYPNQRGSVVCGA